jgi:GNAT superfamily N-acetyltransferase
MTEGLAVERLSAENFGDFIALVDKLAEYELLDPPDAGARERLLRDGTGDAPRYSGFVGRAGGEAVGYLIYFSSYSSFLARPVMYLEDIFVLEGHRRNGYGQALFDHAAREAADGGFGRMEWCVLDWNTPAQKFYEKNRAEKLGWYFYRLPAGELERYRTGPAMDEDNPAEKTPLTLE